MPQVSEKSPNRSTTDPDKYGWSFFDALSWALAQFPRTDLTPTDKVVLLAYALNLNGSDRTTWLSRDDAAELTGLTSLDVDQATQRLVHARAIESAGRFHPEHGGVVFRMVGEVPR